MKQTRLFGILVMFLISLVGTIVPVVDAQDVFIILDSSDIKGMLDNIKYIESLGGSATHRFPPNVIIGDIPEDNISKIETNEHFVMVEINVTANVATSTIDATSLGSQYGKTAEIGAYVWNTNYVSPEENSASALSPDEIITIDGESMTVSEIMENVSKSLIDDMKLPPEDVIATIQDSESASIQDSSISTIQSKPYGAGFYDTSEYMVGDIAIGIIFPESTGGIDSNIESWSWEEMQHQIGHIQKGLNWLASRDKRAKLTFTYDINYQIPTNYEPVSRFPNNDNLWITDVMNHMGYNKYNWFNNVRDYDNTVRDRYKTDWTYTIFMIRSKSCQFCNPGGHAYLGGPYAVIRDGFDWWDIIPQVVAHETGHIFYATDEYDGNRNEPNGYLNQYDNDGSWCLMDSLWQPWFGILCTSSGTRLQLGWRDTNNNGIFDIVDFLPTTMLNDYYPDPTSDDTPTYTGRATTIDTYPNSNPYGSKNRITINKIVTVIYRIDNGNWTMAIPVDGSFDSAIEDFTFTAPQLSDGIHTILVGSTNTAGHWIYDSDTVTINTLKVQITSLNNTYSGSYLPITVKVNDQNNIPINKADVTLKIDNVAYACIPEIECNSPAPIPGLPLEVKGTTNRYGKFIYNYKIPRITETRDIVIKADVSTSDGRNGSSYKYVTVKRR